MFQEGRASNLKLVAIGGQLAAYRAALESRYELDTEGPELEAFLSAPSVVGGAPPARASHKPTSSGSSDAPSAAIGNGKGRRTKGISTSGQRRARTATRSEAETSEGEST